MIIIDAWLLFTRWGITLVSKNNASNVDIDQISLVIWILSREAHITFFCHCWWRVWIIQNFYFFLFLDRFCAFVEKLLSFMAQSSSCVCKFKINCIVIEIFQESVKCLLSHRAQIICGALSSTIARILINSQVNWLFNWLSKLSLCKTTCVDQMFCRNCWVYYAKFI